LALKEKVKLPTEVNGDNGEASMAATNYRWIVHKRNLPLNPDRFQVSVLRPGDHYEPEALGGE
jgi:hypothetical protein